MCIWLYDRTSAKVWEEISGLAITKQGRSAGEYVSFTPGFSRVRQDRLLILRCRTVFGNTWLKPGVNETGKNTLS